MIIQETILYTTILNPNGTREPKLLNGKYENNMRYYLRILQTDTNSLVTYKTLNSNTKTGMGYFG